MRKWALIIITLIILEPISYGYISVVSPSPFKVINTYKLPTGFSVSLYSYYSGVVVCVANTHYTSFYYANSTNLILLKNFTNEGNLISARFVAYNDVGIIYAVYSSIINGLLLDETIPLNVKHSLQDLIRTNVTVLIDAKAIEGRTINGTLGVFPTYSGLVYVVLSQRGFLIETPENNTYISKGNVIDIYYTAYGYLTISQLINYEYETLLGPFIALNPLVISKANISLLGHWSRVFKDVIGTTLLDNYLIIASSPNRIILLNVSNGEKMFSITLPNNITSINVVKESKGVVYLLTGNSLIKIKDGKYELIPLNLVELSGFAGYDSYFIASGTDSQGNTLLEVLTWNGSLIYQKAYQDDVNILLIRSDNYTYMIKYSLKGTTLKVLEPTIISFHTNNVIDFTTADLFGILLIVVLTGILIMKRRSRG